MGEAKPNKWDLKKLVFYYSYKITKPFAIRRLSGVETGYKLEKPLRLRSGNGF